MSFDNDTSVCPVVTQEYSTELLEAVNIYLLIVQGIIVSIIAITGAILTLSLMMIIAMNKELHRRTFIISLQLMVLDMAFIVLVNTSIIITSMAQEWVFGQLWCTVTGFMSHLAAAWRSPIVFVLTLDRFLTIFYPFSYRKIARKLLVAVSALLFLLSCVVPVNPLLNVGCYIFSETALFCIYNGCNTREFLCYASNALGFVLLIVVGALLPLGMYIAMYIKPKRIQSSAPQLGEHEGEDSAAHGQQESAANKRANVTVAILFVCLIGLSLPFYLTIFLSPILNTSPYHYYIQYALNDLFFLYPITDSVIILRNKDIKDTITKIYKKFIN